MLYSHNPKWRASKYKNVMLRKIVELFWEAFNSSLEKSMCSYVMYL